MNPFIPPKPTFTVHIPMRDGTNLVADVFTARPDLAQPLILEITPYGRGPKGLNFGNESGYWMANGYVHVIADCRGKGDSEGEFAAWVHEGRDCHDTIEWLASQPFCSGRVGMRGSSYTGTNPWYAAREQPPHLRAISPSASAAGGIEDISWLGGIWSFEHSLTWGSRQRDGALFFTEPPDWWTLLEQRPLLSVDERLTGQMQPVYRAFGEHRLRDEYVRSIEMSSDDYRRIGIPTLAFTGWQDGCLGGTIKHFVQARSHSPARDRQYLLIGPWNHHGAPDGGYDYGLTPINPLDDLHIPANGFVVARELVRAFFDEHLKEQGRFEQSLVKLFLTGENTWIEAADYPLPQAQPRSLYLHSQGRANRLGGDGVLSWEKPSTEPTDSYVHDPRDPVPSDLPGSDGRPRTLREWPCDLAPLLNRDDMLVYQTAPLTEALRVAGDVKVWLQVSTDALDADFFCRLEDVASDGRGMRLGSHGAGRQRMGGRNGIEYDVPVSPGLVIELCVNLLGIGHTFLPGHRVRLSVCSSAYPETFPNPGNGEPVTTNIDPPRKAIQRVWHDSTHPSRIELPTLPPT